MSLGPLEAITFDCWGTLIVDRAPVDGRGSLEARIEALARIGGIDAGTARELLTVAWRRHHDAWYEGRNYGAAGMAAFCLDEIGVDDDGRRDRLIEAFEQASMELGVEVVAGAPEALTEVRRRGLRTALVCDTGFTPGRIVRQLLAGHDLLEHLELLVFSDEVGVPKPHEKMFRTALAGLDVEASDAAHIGDLRRTDIAGGRAAGMRTVRFAGVNDDPSEHPEADHVIRSWGELPALLDGGTT